MSEKNNSYSLVVVESPGKIKTIKEILGPDYLVCASMGHVMDLLQSARCPLGIDMLNNFKLRYQILPDKKAVVDSILHMGKNAKQIFIATDPDREGEIIAYHLFDLLTTCGHPIFRTEFKEITKDGIQFGLNNLRDLNNNLIYAQQARRAIDRIIGYLTSPYLVQNLKTVSSEKLSAGRVQSIAAKLVVEREKEIKDFKPEDYWILKLSFQSENDKNKAISLKYNNKFSSLEGAEKKRLELLSEKFQIKKISYKDVSEKPKPPLTSDTLMVLAGKYLKLSAAQTMQLAQNLYESGHITYMRADSVRSSPEAIKSCREWLSQHNYVIPKTPYLYKNKGEAQDAHEAIRPTHLEQEPGSLFLSEQEEKLYRLIWNYFVASQMAPAVFSTVNIEIASSKESFFLKGKILKIKGWKEILNYQEEQDDILPNFVKDEKLLLTDVIKEKKQTIPPSRWNEGNLIEEFKKRGIARPSTYATIVPTILNKKYAFKTGTVLFPTPLGVQVVDLLSKSFDFMNYEYTAKIEERLDDLSLGKEKYTDLMRDFYTSYATQLQNATPLLQHQQKCPQCDLPLQVKTSTNSLSLSCLKCHIKLSAQLSDGKILNKDEELLAPDNVKCPECDSRMKRRDNKWGPYYNCLKYPLCRGSRKIKSKQTCPHCSRDMYYHLYYGKLKIMCSGYPNCQTILIPPDGEIFWQPLNATELNHLVNPEYININES